MSSRASVAAADEDDGLGGANVDVVRPPTGRVELSSSEAGTAFDGGVTGVLVLVLLLVATRSPEEGACGSAGVSDTGSVSLVARVAGSGDDCLDSSVSR